MVIEIKTRSKKSDNSPFLTIGVIICLLLVAGVVGSYIYLYLNINKTTKAIAEKDRKALEIDQLIADRERELYPIKGKIEQYSNLMAVHSSPLNIFTFLEENCLPKVWFSDFRFDTNKRTAELSGHANSFGTLEQQADQFRSQPEVLSLEISNVVLDEKEEVDFKFSIIFNSSILVPQIDFEEEEVVEEGEQ